jgi:hypothetical protein
MADLRFFEDSFKRRRWARPGLAHPFHFHALLQLNWFPSKPCVNRVPDCMGVTEMPATKSAMTIWNELLRTRSAKHTRNITSHASRLRRSGPPSPIRGNLQREEGKS